MADSSENRGGLADTADKGNVRLNLWRITANDGTDVYAVETRAFNSWAGQWKIIHCIGGIDFERAVDFFEFSKRRIAGYDWHEGDLVLEEQ